MPTALIVEDEPAANKLLAMLVQFRGYQTESAFTGAEALAKIAKSPPDIVFLDLMLPDINGYEICKALKTQKETTLIPVVMVTARAADENRIRSYGLGADNYIPKPYTPDQIFQAIADADAWKSQLDQQVDEGEINVSRGDEGESLRQLAQLRSLLMARTPLDVEAACRVNETLRLLVDDAETWATEKGVENVASLRYQKEPDRLVLTLLDLSGWFRGDPRDPQERWSEFLEKAGFDEIKADSTGNSLIFVKHYGD